MKNLKIYFFLMVAVLALSSCQKVININLNNANPQLVIDAKITDQPGPYLVKLSKTGNYFDPNTFPSVTGAKVTIADDAGMIDTLTEIQPGVYRTNKLQGTPGRTYNLNILAEGKIYTASSYMPPAVEIDSMNISIPSGGGGPFGGGGPGRRRRPRVNTFFTDPAGQVNYYDIQFKVNDTIKDSSGRYEIYSDRFADGKQVSFSLRARPIPGDVVVAELRSIDKATYDFYSTTNDINERDGQLTSAAPANPVTNVSKGAVGYFAAFSLRVKMIVVK
jgi:hypothetical protein